MRKIRKGKTIYPIQHQGYLMHHGHRRILQRKTLAITCRNCSCLGSVSKSQGVHAKYDSAREARNATSRTSLKTWNASGRSVGDTSRVGAGTKAKSWQFSRLVESDPPKPCAQKPLPRKSAHLDRQIRTRY